MNGLWHDVRYGLRLMRRSMGFTAAAVLSLALGIGANTAIFSLVYTVMLHNLPVKHPEQLVELLHRLPREGHRGNDFDREEYHEFRDHNHVLTAMTAASPAAVQIHGQGLEVEKVNGDYVEGGYFALLGMQAALGRLIGLDDDQPQAAPVAVVSWGYWNNRLHGDPAVLGRRIFVQDTPATIVGVAPRGFAGWQVGARCDLWLPLARSPRRNRLQLAGRLKPGVSLEQAHAELAILDKRMVLESAKTSTNPFTREVVLDLEPAGAGLTSRLREDYGKPLAVLMAVVALLLVIACVNVAGLMLARGAAREREMAMRVALGARRMRLARQLLTESVLLSAAGTLASILLSYSMTKALAVIIMSSRGPGQIQLDVRPETGALLLTTAAGLVTGLLFGLAPALRASLTAPASPLKKSGRPGETRLGRLFGKSLVVEQVMLSVVLLTAASLFIGHLASLERQDLGFERDHVLVVSLDPSPSGYQGERLARAYRELMARMQAIPGVRFATLSAVTPLSGAGASRSATVEGYQASPGEIRLLVENWVAPGYFATMGTPLLAGRDFGPHDEGGPRVAIINRLMAEYYFHDSSPLGKHVTFDDGDGPYEIIGVAGDAKYEEIREKTWRGIYFDAFQASWAGSEFSLRTSGNPAAVIPAVRQAVKGLLPTVPVTRVTTLAEQVDATIVPERLIALLSGWFGGLGTLLAAIGLCGLLAYTVARRTNEIGIRMALGANRGDVVSMVLRDALAMVLAGLALGVPLALWGRRFAAGLIAGLPGNAGPVVEGGIAMLAVGLLAAYVPARRAAGVEPMEALREE